MTRAQKTGASPGTTTLRTAGIETM